jgi:hypothetical protein
VTGHIFAEQIQFAIESNTILGLVTMIGAVAGGAASLITAWRHGALKTEVDATKTIATEAATSASAAAIQTDGHLSALREELARQAAALQNAVTKNDELQSTIARLTTILVAQNTTAAAAVPPARSVRESDKVPPAPAKVEVVNEPTVVVRSDAK